MTTDIVRAGQSALAVASDQSFWTETQLAALAQIGVQNAPNSDLAVFLNYAQRTGLDPFARQIYMIGRRTKVGDNWVTKWTIQAAIDGLRIVAERSGEYAGQTAPEFCGEDGAWRDTWTSTKPPVAARVGVMRRGFQAPLYGVAYYEDYVQTAKDGKPTGMWSKPRIMLAKCAEALALRKAFPNDLSGLYTAEEMSQADSHTPPAPAAKPAQVHPVVVDIETGEVVEGELVEDHQAEYERMVELITSAETVEQMMSIAENIRNRKPLPAEMQDTLRDLYAKRMVELTKKAK